MKPMSENLTGPVLKVIEDDSELQNPSWEPEDLPARLGRPSLQKSLNILSIDNSPDELVEIVLADGGEID